MYQFFKVNDPFRLIGVSLFLLLWSVLYLVFSDFQLTAPQLSWMLLGERLGDGYFLYQDIIDDNGPLSAGFFVLLDFLFGKSILAYELLGRLLILFQVVYWNNTLIRYRVFDENTYLPAIVLLSLFHLSFDMLSLTPALLGSTFLLLALNQLFSQTVLQKDSSESTLLIGIYGGLACGFHPIYVVFLPFMIFSGIAISSFSFRQLMLSLAGYLLPLLLISVFYYWNDGLDEAIQIWPLIFLSEKYLYQSYFFWLILGAFPLLLALTGFLLNSIKRVATINQQKQRQILIIWLLFAGIAIFFAKRQATYQWVSLLPTLSYLITSFFLQIKKKVLIKLSFFLLTILMPLTSWWLMNTKQEINENYLVQNENPSESYPEGLMILGDDLSGYLNSQLKGPFLNFHLSKLYLEQGRNLAQRAQLFTMIHSQRPPVILDTEGVFEKILKDYPELQREYSQAEKGVYRLIK
ncbi:hypothetical protein SAMN04488104_10191 [Algoriphagus faecimaris]|uniref:Dolichyl-phosphate-mannose-protein mannosyltransferase n=1 Tax=Algoriphagus faecimaris TaxID=686796 RepID=A0A1G6SVA9_9BACT|nr:hypothetical protein [Algoriphagus faecimaris]SDD20651.1 hypothetical protein SAMN04488104_10191 [Algoriphagus faecimaris]